MLGVLCIAPWTESQSPSHPPFFTSRTGELSCATRYLLQLLYSCVHFHARRISEMSGGKHPGQTRGPSLFASPHTLHLSLQSVPHRPPHSSHRYTVVVLWSNVQFCRGIWAVFECAKKPSHGPGGALSCRVVSTVRDERDQVAPCLSVVSSEQGNMAVS
jgi:hypothetical protein